MKKLLIALALVNVCPDLFAGMIVTDGFESQFVPRSPDIEDPEDCRRLFDVYLPPEFFAHPEMTFPTVYFLGSLGANNNTFSPQNKLALDMLLETNQAVPMIVIEIDPSVNPYDGSFYVDSILNGAFERYIVEELIPYVNEKYRQKTTDSADAAPFRAITGHSMGGYGTLYYGVKYPDLFRFWGGASPTGFWTTTTNLASPPCLPDFPEGNSMYTFNLLLLRELERNGGVLNPTNGDLTFAFYAWAGAFSPVSSGQSDLCSTELPVCRATPPFCCAYPFVTPLIDGQLRPELIDTCEGQSLVPDNAIIAQWQTFDPFFLLDGADPEVLKRQTIYFDSGSALSPNDPFFGDPIDNVSSRFFSDKLNTFDVDHEYLLFNGGHTSCLTVPELECYRFTTTFKLFSGGFASAGIYTPDVISTLVGDMTIELTGNSVMSIEDRALMGVETDSTTSITNITIRLLDQSRFEIGTKETLGGGLQVGNQFGKANFLFDPTREDDVISFTLELDGPEATFQVGKQGFLGFGIGVTGNQVEVPNFFGVRTLSNVNSVTINLAQGRFEHDQIASSLDERGSLLALGAAQGYTFMINPDFAVLAGGANIATITEGNKIHPTVQDKAGVIDPGGIRNRIDIVENPDSTFDVFYGPPKGLYASKTFSLNQMQVGITSSSLMLFDSNKEQIGPNATQQELFDYLSVAEYTEQGRKRAPITELDDQLISGFLTNAADMTVDINRPVVDPVMPCSPLSDPFDVDKVIEDGAVGVKIANIDGTPTVIRVYDLDPEI